MAAALGQQALKLCSFGTRLKTTNNNKTDSFREPSARCMQKLHNIHINVLNPETYIVAKFGPLHDVSILHMACITGLLLVNNPFDICKIKYQLI